MGKIKNKVSMRGNNKFKAYRYNYPFTKEDYYRIKTGFKFKNELKWEIQKPGFYLDSTGRFKLVSNQVKSGKYHWRVFDLKKDELYFTRYFIQAKYLANLIVNELDFKGAYLVKKS